MKKMIAMLMIGSIAAVGTTSAMAAPTDHKAPSHQVHKMDKKPLPPKAAPHAPMHKAPAPHAAQFAHKAPVKHNVKHPHPMKHKAPIKHDVKHPAGPDHKLPPKHR